MRDRTEPIVIPDHMPVYTAEIPGLGDLHIQPLRFAVRQDWLREMERTAARIQAAPTVEHSGAMYGIHAAAVGLGWAHHARELETKREDFADFASYGLAVLEELENAGVYAATVLALGKRIADEQTNEMRELAGAAAMVPFFKGRRAASGSSSSEPVRDTAGTPGRSKNSKAQSGKS